LFGDDADEEYEKEIEARKQSNKSYEVTPWAVGGYFEEAPEEPIYGDMLLLDADPRYDYSMQRDVSGSSILVCFVTY